MRIEAPEKDPNAESKAQECSTYLLDVGEGWHKLDECSNIYLRPSTNLIQSPTKLINSIFSDIAAKYSDTACLTSREILVKRKTRLQYPSNEIIDRFSERLNIFLVQTQFSA